MRYDEKYLGTVIEVNERVDETDTMSSHEDLLWNGAIDGREDAFIRGFNMAA